MSINITNRTITIQPKALLCEIQPVTVEKIMGNGKEESKTGVIDRVNTNTETLSESQIQQGEHLLCDYSDIFSKNDLYIGFTSIIKHKINQMSVLSNRDIVRYHQVWMRK